MPQPQTRESWLERATEQLRPLYAQAGHPLPRQVRISIGWPDKGGTRARKAIIGQAWHGTATADGIGQIFISPRLDRVDSVEVLATLAHELAHLALGPGVGHKGPFVPLVRSIGLEGKATATTAGESFTRHAQRVIADLGNIPHARITATPEGEKKQTTRMVKCECGDCGYVVRTTRKWLTDVGAPHCPNHGEMGIEGGDAGD